MHAKTPNRCQIRLRELRAIARKHGGRCTSDEYIHRQAPMEFACRLGHVWKAMPQSILNGHWCPRCARVPADGLKRAQAIARERGGRCLSTTYVVKPGMQWRCAEGHEWCAPPARIRKGAWCPLCAGRKTIEDMQALAARHGGRCLSRSMKEGAGDACLQWECAEGHRFAVRARCVRIGQWCPTCRKAGSSWPRALARAEELGGACLDSSEHGKHSRTARWRCAQGHIFTGNAYRIARGAWCPRCAGRRLALEDMQARAAEHGGRCLARKFDTVRATLRWECAKGHRWWQAPMTMRGDKAWCPKCAPKRERKPPAARSAVKRVSDIARELAATKGGVCLAGPDARSNDSVRWRCAEGHVWTNKVYGIAAGRWCPRCSGRRLGIEHMHQMAAERGGRCVSRRFVDAETKLQWECAEGHRWWARPTVVRCAGTWCPHCAWDANAARMRSEAKDRR